MAHWSFEPETVADREVLEITGTGPAMHLDERVTAVPGALAFDGRGAAVAPAAPHLVLNQLFGFTVAFRLLVAEPPTGEWRGVFYKPVAEHDARGFGMWLYPDAMRLRVQLFTAAGGGPEYADSARRLTTGEWTHVAVVVDPDELRLYLDGAIDTTTGLEHPVVTPAGPIHLGKDPTGLGFSGRLADVRVYASALSAESVGALQDP